MGTWFSRPVHRIRQFGGGTIRAAGLAAAFGFILGMNNSATASMTLLPAGPQQGVHAGNLVINGSFENGAPPVPGSIVFWATGTGATPFGMPTGWSSSGSNQAYAYWGSTEASPPYRTAGSGVLPHGQAGMYFGNATATVDLVPTYQPSREVTFAGTPTFTSAFGSPVRLWQNVPTDLFPSPAYLLSFWVSGEMAGYGGGAPGYDGIFGLRVTNVLPGDPVQHFVVPSGGTSNYGDALRYEFNLAPLNPNLPIQVEFINYGHMDLSPFGGFGTTELVIDDVIVNLVPEPGAALLAAAGGALLLRRRCRAGR